MTCKDRLAELQHIAAGAAGAAGAGTGVYHDTVQLEPEVSDPPPDSLKEIEQIYHEVESARCWLDELVEQTRLVRRLHADPTFHHNQELQQQLEAAVSASAALGGRLGPALRRLEERGGAGGGAGAGAAGRVARLQYLCLRRRYADALRAHHAALDALRDQRLQLLHAQIKLTNLAISEEECQSLLESNNISLFVDNVRAETAAARGALRAVEARHEELARVEAALRDVRELFLQLATLVALQQDHIDSVEYYALQTTQYVETGGTHLLKGTVTRTKARKKKLSVVVCLAAGFLLVLLVLVLT